MRILKELFIFHHFATLISIILLLNLYLLLKQIFPLRFSHTQSFLLSRPGDIDIYPVLHALPQAHILFGILIV